MKTFWRWLRVFMLCSTLPIEVWSKVCTGGYHCTALQECCAQGCCVYVPSSGYNPVTNNVDNYYTFNTPIKYYTWLILFIMAMFISISWCCRSRGGWRGWWRFIRDSCYERYNRNCFRASSSSEPDSAGSCYFPPQYSRCGSICRPSSQAPPPPYSEVTAKPDLYPMVIYCAGDKSEGELMAYFYKNHTFRPPGSISATSTADSLSSSYLCNATNEANTLLPPPYSCAGSLEWSSGPATSTQRQTLLRSVSSIVCRNDDNVPQSQKLLHHSKSAQLTTRKANKIPKSFTSNNLQTRDNCNQESEALHTVRSNKNDIAHCQSSSSSVPNSKVQIESNSFTSQNNHPYAANIASNSNNHQYFNMCEYKPESRQANLNIKETNSPYNINENNSPKIVTSRLQLNQYLTGDSNESLEDNDQTNDFSMSKKWTKKYNNSLEMNEIKENNDSGKDVDYALNICEKNESSCNLNSLEENQMCSFFSQSIARTTNDNMSSDYSIFTKNLNNFGSKEDISRIYSVDHSMTGSEISSLANLGTPDSPPQATSPTSEIKDLLDKIQKLPSQMSNFDIQETEIGENSVSTNKNKQCFGKVRKSTLYMPLTLATNVKSFYPGKISPNSNKYTMKQSSRKHWLSRSAPSTPCGNGIIPSILSSQRSGIRISGRTSRLSKNNQDNQNDDSTLLMENNASGDEVDNPYNDKFVN